MNIKIPTKKLNKSIFIVVTGIGCTVVGVCILLLVDDISVALKLKAVYNERPEAQLRFHKVLEDLLTITPDKMLSQNVSGLYIHSDTNRLHCLNGYVELVYGTDRDIATVLNDYSRNFAEMGWKRVEGRTSIEDGTLIYEDETTYININQVQEPGYHGKQKFNFVYRLEFRYAEPSFWQCFG